MQFNEYTFINSEKELDALLKLNDLVGLNVEDPNSIGEMINKILNSSIQFDLKDVLVPPKGEIYKYEGKFLESKLKYYVSNADEVPLIVAISVGPQASYLHEKMKFIIKELSI